MWLSHSRGRAWNCEQCKTSAGLRAKRGNCGGEFKQGLPQSQRDEHGLYVMGYRVAPDCGEEYSDYKIRSCPVASSNQLASLIQAYQRHKNNILPLNLSYPKPTCAVIEAIEVLHYNTDEAQHRAHQRAMKEAKENG